MAQAYAPSPHGVLQEPLLGAPKPALLEPQLLSPQQHYSTIGWGREGVYKYAERSLRPETSHGGVGTGAHDGDVHEAGGGGGDIQVARVVAAHDDTHHVWIYLGGAVAGRSEQRRWLFLDGIRL